MGSPGAGKTTVGRILANRLGRKVVDVDDDVLETVWGMSVADKVRYDWKERKIKTCFEHSFCPVCSVISVSLKILIRSNLFQVPQGPGVEINVILWRITATCCGM